MSESNTQSINTNISPRDRAIVKAQRNYCLEVYDISLRDLGEIDRIKDNMLERWRALNTKPESEWSIIEKYQSKVIASEDQIYNNTLSKVRDKINQWNEELSIKIIEYNIRLGYDECDLHKDLEDSGYESDDEDTISTGLSEVDEGEITESEITDNTNPNN